MTKDDDTEVTGSPGSGSNPRWDPAAPHQDGINSASQDSPWHSDPSGSGWATAAIPLDGAAPPPVVPLRPPPIHEPWTNYEVPAPAPLPPPLPAEFDKHAWQGSPSEIEADQAPPGYDGGPPPPGAHSAAGFAAGGTVLVPGSGPPEPKTTARRRPLVTALVAAVVVLAGAGVVAAIRFTSQDSTAPPSPGPSATSVTQPPDPSTLVQTVTSTAVRTLTTQATTPTPVVTTPTAASPDPMGGGFQALSCGTNGYIVQVASELNEAAYRARVAQVRAASQLPVGAHYLTGDGDCGLFTVQDSLWVLYTGPFASPADACPTRLQSPADAFIKGTTDGTKQLYFGCLCVTDVARMPAITTVGQTDVWVGELQRALRVKLEYDVGDIDGPPPTWGVYTDGTAAAVARFQSSSGLAATGRVDGATWQQIKNGSCS